MDTDQLYSFGINTYHQLGQTPYCESSNVPKQMNAKSTKGRPLKGVCVGRFHTVVWTNDSLFSVGLNAGQLGKISFVLCSFQCVYLYLKASFLLLNVSETHKA